MVVDVATALMYGTQGHSSLFPMFGFDTMSTLGKNCTHFLLHKLVLPVMDTLLGEWGASHCTVEASRGCGHSCVTPPQGASTRVRELCVLSSGPSRECPKLTPLKALLQKCGV